MNAQEFLWQVTVEMPGWPRPWGISKLRRQLRRDPRVKRFVKGWPLWMRAARRHIHPHITIEVAARDQASAYEQARKAVSEAPGRLGLPTDASPWTLSTDWERA